jgi:alkylhydroperoxidase family enzyme
LAHGNKLREFLPDEDILALAEGKSGPSISGTDQAIIRFARQIARDASRVTSGDVDQLKKQGLSDEDIFDIVATVAGRAFFTKMLDALGVESDSSFLNLDETFRRPLTVGRPIGFRKVETLPAS